MCITPVIDNRPYCSGSFSSTDPAIRTAVRDLVDEAVDVAGRMGANYVKFRPGQDGRLPLPCGTRAVHALVRDALLGGA